MQGDYTRCHPNNHVNLSQSPMMCTRRRSGSPPCFTPEARDGARTLRAALAAKAESSPRDQDGRTQLQDAVPMTLGQEFMAFAVTTGEDIARLRETARLFLEVNMGGTAIGTGINADPRYPQLVVEHFAGTPASTSSLPRTWSRRRRHRRVRDVLGRA